MNCPACKSDKIQEMWSDEGQRYWHCFKCDCHWTSREASIWQQQRIEDLEEGLRANQYTYKIEMGFDHEAKFYCIGCGASKGDPCEPTCWLAKLLEGK